MLTMADPQPQANSLHSSTDVAGSIIKLVPPKIKIYEQSYK